MIWIVQAVLQKSASSPRLFWMIDGPIPMSENMFRPWMNTFTRSIRPNAFGNSRRVRIRFDTSRSNWLDPCPANVQVEPRTMRCFNDNRPATNDLSSSGCAVAIVADWADEIGVSLAIGPEAALASFVDSIPLI